jgi:DNA-binding CsgD family transcriptional regulator
MTALPASAATVDPAWIGVSQLAHRIVAYGAEVGLPCVAAQSDLGDAAPMADREGRPYAAVFPWVAGAEDYWRNRRLALESTFLHAARLLAEPIWYAEGRLGSWRETRLLDGIDCSRVTEQFGFTAALIAPVHLPAGQVGAVVWVATGPLDMAAVFARHAEPMFALAVRFLASHAELVSARARLAPAQLSRREAQCVRWAAAGKTNAEIGTILSLSVSTVRFHLRNAAEKLGAATRARMIQIATGHGFLGPDA